MHKSVSVLFYVLNNFVFKIFRRALSDPLPEVRIAAATTFDSLHSTVGVRALDDILPPLLKQLVCILLMFENILAQ